jgi:hypothetical protein
VIQGRIGRGQVSILLISGTEAKHLTKLTKDTKSPESQFANEFIPSSGPSYRKPRLSPLSISEREDFADSRNYATNFVLMHFHSFFCVVSQDSVSLVPV